MSRAWGWISSQHVPLSIRCWLYTGYARMYGVNLEEAAHSLEHYNSLCEFFIRQLKEGVRPVAEYEPLVSITHLDVYITCTCVVFCTYTYI